MVSERVKVHVGLAAAMIVLIACVALLVFGAIHQADPRAAVPGSKSPDFSLRDADHHSVELSEVRGTSDLR